MEQLVQEILSLVEQARGVSCAAALSVVSTMLAGLGRPPASAPRTSTPRKAAASPRTGAGGKPRKKPATSPMRSPASRRGTRSIASEAVVPVAVAASGSASGSSGTAGPTTLRMPSSVGQAPALNVAPSSPAIMSSATAAPGPEREALVLYAVRALVRATAGEVAGRSGQPNGSVSVTLRALVAQGQVAKTQTQRGTEYSLVSPGSVRPFKQASPAAPMAPSGELRVPTPAS